MEERILLVQNQGRGLENLPQAVLVFLLWVLNGWLEGVPERTRQIYILKNLKNRHMWAERKSTNAFKDPLITFEEGSRSFV